MKNVLSKIEASVQKLLNHPSFARWLATQDLNAGGCIAVNSSFVFRDIQTVKSTKFLAVAVEGNGQLNPKPLVVERLRLSTDFKHFSPDQKNLPPSKDMSAAVNDEIRRLGYLLFLMIARIEDNIILDEPLGHSAFDTVSWDPSLRSNIVISGKTILIAQTHDEDALWQKMINHYNARGEDPPDGLRGAFGIALDKLQDKAVAEVHIPTPGTKPDDGITQAILKVLQEQRNQYADALKRYDASGERDETALNEILRIAYNFASDATGYFKLIMAVCDLKPIVFWGTIGEHYALSEAFRSLPWSRSRNKPSLKNYQLTISDSRNSAFHNLFPFRKTLKVKLPKAALRGAELRIFSEYTKRKENQLSYEDKELVDVLTEFTRSRERRAATRFWRQNLKVMDATIALFSATNDFLKILLLTVSKLKTVRSRAAA